MNAALSLVQPAESDPPRCLISVLGPMRVALDGRDIPLPKRKARALVAYLAMTDGRQETRERLVGLLWSEAEEAKARSSLRQELHQLHEDLDEAGFTGLARSRLRVGLDGPGIDVDCNLILDMARAGQVHPRLAEEPMISESYLRDLDDVDPAFGVWAKARRQNFHDNLLRALEAILRDGAADRSRRRGCAQAIMNLDPTHEEACRVFMRLSAEAGDSAAAQRAYNTLYETLDKEYDAEPAEETIALVAGIKQGLIGPVAERARASLIFPQPAPPVALPSNRFETGARMALLIEPFGLNGIDPDSLHLAEGFRHDLIACLVRFREWFIVSGTSLPEDQLHSGRVTGAYSVAATAYRAGDAISLVLTLREMETGIHAWSDRFVLTLSNWFESQQKIVRQIAISLNVQISMERLTRIADEPDVTLAVYDLWLRGQAALHHFSRQNWETAARMFTAATQRAPEFARGYSGLAQMHSIAHFVHPGISRPPDHAQRALDLARKAVALDPMDSRSQLAMGWALAMAKQYRAAAVHMDLVRELNPYDSWNLISTALCQGYCGHPEVAHQVSAQAFGLTLAPSRLHWAYQVQIAFIRGEYAEAVEAADRAQDVMLGMVAWRAAALVHLGERAEARETAQRFLNLAREAWAGDDPPTDQAIGRWLLHMCPVGNPGVWTKLHHGVTAAGIPDGGAKHHGW